MKKLLAILLALLSLLTLVACGGDGGTTPPDDPKDPPNEHEKPIEYIVIVRPDKSLELVDVASAIREKNDKTLSVVDDDNASVRGEIVFGAADRAVTKAAAEALDALLTEDDSIGYVIYKDETGNVAVYWSDGFTKDMAIDCFIEDYINLETLAAYLPGVIKSEVIPFDSYLYDSTWGELKKKAPADVFDALESLAVMFDGSAIADWMANLWEPYICVCGNCAAEGKEIACYGGAFYYANSARDYEGFLPDMENTAFVLGWIAGNGAFSHYGNKYANALPDDIKAKIVKFVQSLQSEADGYFYHPQWGSNVATDRRGRDLSNAVTVLKNLGAEPLYPTALDRLQNKGTSALVRPLGVSAVTAVSAVIPSSFEQSLASEESYMAWLKSTTNNMFENTTGAHTINAGLSQIKAAGYLDITLDYLDEKQEELYQEMKAAYDKDPENNPEPTGLWQRNINYNAVWGLLKFTPFYNDGKREIKYAEEAIKTCVKVIMMDAETGESYQMNDVYNQWSGANNLIANIKNYNPDILPRIYEITNEHAVEMIRNSMAKLSKFLHSDGSYSYNPGHSAPTLYGTSVSLGLEEGDVNATILACGMYRSVFTVLGYDVIHMCDYRDGERFLETISSLGSAEKQELPGAEHIDFENGYTSGVSSSYGSGGYTEIVTDPKDPANSVLKSVVFAGSNDALKFTVGGSSSAGCLTFEADIMIESVSGTDYFFQLYMGSNVYMVDFLYQGGKVVLRDNSTNAGNGKTGMLNFTAELGEWFNLRIEFYTNADDPAKPTVKIYKNGTLTATSTNFYNSHVAGNTPATGFGTVHFWSMRRSNSVMYVDNVKAERESKVLTD